MKAATLIVLAKSPRPGAVKTRLQPVFSAREAAALAQAAIRDTLDATLAAGAGRVVLGWDGPLVSWLPKGVTIVSQRGSSLDERLENVFQDVLGAEQDHPTLLIGMDAPQVAAADLDVEWGEHDALLGPAEDGGYWAIGFRRFVPGAIRGVPMSTARTGQDQLDRLRSLGLDVGQLPSMRDMDTPDDAVAAAALAPHSRFGRLHRRIVESPCSLATLFDAALVGETVHIRVQDPGVGAMRAVVPAVIDAGSWQQLTTADELLVSRCEGPVLDLGCGPGRFVEAIAGRGLPALGIDLSRGAVAQVRDHGACALVRDVHDRLPAEGRWGTVLLADGNIGIGGDPLGLLRRVRELLHPGAAALVEVSDDPDHDSRTTVTLHGPGGRTSVAIPWAVVGTRTLVRLGAAAGFLAVEEWRLAGRAFVKLRHAG